MSRKQFIKSEGGTCKSWYWSWSFVNPTKKIVIFGAWDRYTNGKMALILSEDWKTTRRGQKSKGYEESLQHIRLVLEQGFRLMTFPMAYSNVYREKDENAPAKIAAFKPELTERRLTKIGREWYAVDSDIPSLLAEELIAPEKYSEGARFEVTINAYERNVKARSACISHHGLRCKVCEFDFGKVYGVIGEGYIQVHHLVPIGKIGKQYQVDPILDLVPVCPNCHAMIHRAEPPLTVEQLRIYLSERRET